MCTNSASSKCEDFVKPLNNGCMQIPTWNCLYGLHRVELEQWAHRVFVQQKPAKSKTVNVQCHTYATFLFSLSSAALPPSLTHLVATRPPVVPSHGPPPSPRGTCSAPRRTSWAGSRCYSREARRPHPLPSPSMLGWQRQLLVEFHLQVKVPDA